MNLHILEMLYGIPELQTLAYQFYQQIPDRVAAEENLQQVWDECTAVSDPRTHKLFLRLEEAVNRSGAIQSRAAFFAGAVLIWQLSRAMDQL